MNDTRDRVKEERGKLLGLSEAVRRFVGPGMKVHLAGGIGGPSAAICELIRQYRGKDPGFTLIQSTLTGHGLNLVHCALAKTLVCSVCTDISAQSRPSKIVQRAYAEKRLNLENWSLYSLQQRLMAGAHGVPFLTTRSVMGSSIALDKGESFKEMDDPFGSGQKVGVVKALNPDISIVHGCVADEEGNVIMPQPVGEDLWGCLASTGGVIVTVERVVPREFIREYAALVKIPAYCVKAVCEVPMGLHPFSLPNPGIRDFSPYEKDIPFLNDLHEASKNDETLDAWIERWIVDCPTQKDYLDRLGRERTDELRRMTTIGLGGTSSVPDPRTKGKVEYTPEEMVLVALMREIVGAARKSDHRIILSGAGSRGVAAFGAYYALRSEGHEVDLVTGNGQVGFTPLPGISILSTEPGVRTCTMLTDTIMAQGILVGGRNNKCLSVLGAGQIDRLGNINSTVTSAGKFLVGSGGANDAMNAGEVIVALDQKKERFVESLPYVTGKGDSVTTVISTLAVFRKQNPGAELQVVALFPDESGRSMEERLHTVQEGCGWPISTAGRVEELPPPEQGELDLLRWLIAAPPA